MVSAGASAGGAAASTSLADDRSLVARVTLAVMLAGTSISFAAAGLRHCPVATAEGAEAKAVGAETSGTGSPLASLAGSP